MHRLILLLAISFPAFAFAEPPRAVVTGPTDGQPGDFIEINGEDSVADHWLWVVEPSRFSDNKPTYKISNEGKLCQLASRVGIYRVLAIVSNEDGIAYVWHTVTITTTPGPPQPPNPNPPGPPQPPTPNPPQPTRFGLVDVTRQAVLRTSGIDRRLCTALGADFGIIASKIAAGVITSFADANAQLKARTTATRQGVEAQWKPVTDAIGAKLNDLRATGKILTTDMPAVQAAFEEIRDGFLSAAQ